MNEEEVKQAFAEFQTQFPGMDKLMIMDGEGNILMSTDTDFISAEEAKIVLDVWKSGKSPLEVGGLRYPVLKWDDIQFAAKNIPKKIGLIGSIGKSGNYCVAQYTGGGNLLQSTIDLNRWCWNII